MRLTLRTLLAYLDDTLEPAQARLIGQKVSESDAAQELIARIKQVTRRRRLTSPPASGPSGKLDPNMIAEYLDNVLPANELAEVEETCLSSDLHLAEMAACHQILTLVLGEPALVPPTARQRMYALIKGREAIPNRKVSAQAVGQGALAQNGAGGDDADDTLLLGLSLSRPGSLLRWVLPLVAACLLVAAGLAIWMAIAPSLQAPHANLPANSQPVAAATGSDLTGQPSPSDKKASVENQAEAALSKKTTPEDKGEGANGKKGQVEAKGETVTVKKTPIEGKVEGGQQKTGTSKKTEAAEAKKASRPASVAAKPPLTERRELGKCLLLPNWPGVLLERSKETDPWRRLRPQSRILSMDSLMSLPGYRSELRMDSGVSLVLWGILPELVPLPLNESVVVFYANPDFDLDLRLDRGRVLLRNQKEAGPAHVRVRFAGEAWDITLPNNETEVSIDLSGHCHYYTKDNGVSDPEKYVKAITLKGQATLQIRYDQHTIRQGEIFEWDNRFGAPAGPRDGRDLLDFWSEKSPAQNRNAQAFENALKNLASRLAARDAVDIVLGEALQDADPPSHALAIRCLGAIEAWSSLLDALVDGQFPSLRFLAEDELRYVLGVDARNDEKLMRALRAKNYSDTQARLALQLLHSFTPEDWADPATRSAVVEHLMNEKAGIRQLAYGMLMFKIPEGQKIAYDPLGDIELRERGYAEWKKAAQNFKPKREPERKP
jgi:hypothetical protein